MKGLYLRRKKCKPIWVNFRYEKLPHFCFECGVIGHESKYCEIPKKPREESWREHKPSFGVWLRADGFKRGNWNESTKSEGPGQGERKHGESWATKETNKGKEMVVAAPMATVPVRRRDGSGAVSDKESEDIAEDSNSIDYENQISPANFEEVNRMPDCWPKFEYGRGREENLAELEEVNSVDKGKDLVSNDHEGICDIVTLKVRKVDWKEKVGSWECGLPGRKESYIPKPKPFPCFNLSPPLLPTPIYYQGHLIKSPNLLNPLQMVDLFQKKSPPKPNCIIQDPNKPFTTSQNKNQNNPINYHQLPAESSGQLILFESKKTKPSDKHEQSQNPKPVQVLNVIPGGNPVSINNLQTTIPTDLATRSPWKNSEVEREGEMGLKRKGGSIGMNMTEIGELVVKKRKMTKVVEKRVKNNTRVSKTGGVNTRTNIRRQGGANLGFREKMKQTMKMAQVEKLVDVEVELGSVHINFEGKAGESQPNCD